MEWWIEGSSHHEDPNNLHDVFLTIDALTNINFAFADNLMWRLWDLFFAP